MPIGMQYANIVCKQKVCGTGNDFARRVLHYKNMSSDNKNFLRSWRKKAGLTQEQLADAVDTTKAVISGLENGHRALSPKWLRRLAPVLNTQPGHILDTDPADINDDLIDIWDRISEQDRSQAIKVLKSFISKSGA